MTGTPGGYPLHELERCGQSVWTDVISRAMVQSGELARYIDEDGITGVTANPTIFEKAIAGSHDYDDTIRAFGSPACTPAEIYETLAIQDVAAATLLRPVYDRTGGTDGFVSIEVSPELASQTEATMEEARRFWSKLGRPNVMIKVPATSEGIPAIEELTAEGLNINITLIFAVEVYEQVMEAYLKGLERRVALDEPINRVSSVASFFVSRVDTLADKLLEEKASAAGDETARRKLEGLKGKAAIANAKIAYAHFERVFGSERFTRLQQRGAQVQRPLWASTSTKNPAYPDTMYVGPLIGPRTVNTMTLETIDAFRDHGTVDCGAIRKGLDEAQQVFDDLEAAGISMKAVTDQLTKEGVEKFTASLHKLLEAIRERQGSLVRA